MAGTIGERLQEAAAGKRSLDFDPLSTEEGRVVFVRLDDIEPDPEQPRKDVGDLEELAASIRTHGVINPIVVRPVSDQKFRIVAGERRYRASRIAGQDKIQAIIRTLEEQSRLEIQLIENLHRKDLNPFEEATVYRRLMDEFGLTQEQMARRVGRSQATINEVLLLLQLPPTLRSEYRTSDKVSKSVLIEIAKQSDSEKQAVLWERAKTGGLTVREARVYKRGEGHPRTTPGTKPKRVFNTNHGATVIVQDKTDCGLSIERIVSALEEALTAAQKYG
jgi:ParB family chromosome partitioning protein